MERADGVLLTWVPLAWKPSEPRRVDKPHQPYYLGDQSTMSISLGISKVVVWLLTR